MVQMGRKTIFFVEKRSVFVKSIVLMSLFVIITMKKCNLVLFVASNIYKKMESKLLRKNYRK